MSLTGVGTYTVGKSDITNYVVTAYTWWDYTATWDETYSVTTQTSSTGLGSATNTGTHSLTTTLDIRDSGVETGRVSFKFEMELPTTALTVAGSGGFPILRWGTEGANGTITLFYIPVTSTSSSPHALLARVTGVDNREVTVTLASAGTFISVFLEYDGLTLTLVADSSADQLISSIEMLPATSPAPLLFARDVTNLYFRNLKIYNKALLEDVTDTATSFPYMLWDAEDSGVIAVIPTSSIPDDYFSFIDHGYSAGHVPATVSLATSSTVVNPVLYVNERVVTLDFAPGSATDFVTWLTGGGSKVHAFAFDGRTERIMFTKVSSTIATACHYLNTEEGRMSFSIRLSSGAIVENDWNKTKAILGKIPQQYALPRTGEPNKGISLLGTSATLSTPKGIQMEYRDDSVRTAGRVIGSTENRPGSKLALTRLAPTPFFGSAKAPFPKKSLVYGTPESLSDNLSDDNLYAYGILWERYLSMSGPDDVTMGTAPYNRSRAGDTIGAFSIDIPLGQTLRGMDICFTAPPPGLRGNVVQDTGYVYNWGEGTIAFPFALTGNSSYVCLYYLLIATDSDASIWMPIPSIGVDAVKVDGATTWKEISFRAVDFDTLLDSNGYSLLLGSRRVHFKMVLAKELTAVNYQGLSYKMQSSSKK